VGHVALFVALAVVPVLALNSLATATAASEGGTDPTAAAATTGRPALTDTQRQCLSDQGVTLPTGGADGAKPEFTREQRRQLREAGAACGLRAMIARKGRPGARGLGAGLTDAQRQCLADQGVSLPVRSADHPHTPVSAEQRDALRQAATTCGLPERAFRGGGDAKI
jgi:hypothetical protein